MTAPDNARERDEREQVVEMAGRGRPRRQWTRANAAVLVAVLTAGLVAGCSGTGADTVSSSGAGGSADAIAPGPARAAVPGSGKAFGAPGVNRTIVQTRAVIRTGSLTVVSKNLDHARAAVDELLARYGGFLAREHATESRKGQPEHALLVLRVPTSSFDTVMGALSGLGRTPSTHQDTEDVTTQVIDVDSRVATERASIQRLRKLLRTATNVDDMISIEREIATREADLESLEAQQAYLHDQTSMSTITLRLSEPPAHGQPQRHESGFLAGLADGWHAMTAFLAGLATVVGAALPFALAIALVGVPLWLLVRALLRRRPRPAGAEASGATPPGTPD